MPVDDEFRLRTFDQSRHVANEERVQRRALVAHEASAAVAVELEVKIAANQGLSTSGHTTGCVASMTIAALSIDQTGQPEGSESRTGIVPLPYQPSSGYVSR